MLMVNEPCLDYQKLKPVMRKSHDLEDIFFAFLTLVKLTAVTSCILSDLCYSPQKRTSYNEEKT